MASILYAGAEAQIRAQLEALANGQKVKMIAVGQLTPTQLNAVNAYRISQELPPIEAEIMFIGVHTYKRRIVEDGYTIDDVIEQLVSATSDTSVAILGKTMTAIQNPVKRADRLGNMVKDEIVLECSRRHPKSELFSIIARGDTIKPK